jgi:hypothetical protein
VTLPSSDWKERSGPGDSKVGFQYQGIHQMYFGVHFRKEDEAEFEKFVNDFRKNNLVGKTDLVDLKESKGQNSLGNPFYFATFLEKGDKDNGTFVGMSNTWCKEKGITIVIIFEAVPKMSSEAGRSAEMKVFEDSAKIICLSADKDEPHTKPALWRARLRKFTPDVAKKTRQ